MHEVEIDDFIDAELSSVRVFPVQVAGNTGVPQSQAGLAINDDPLTEDVGQTLLEDGYSDESNQIARYLATLARPAGMKTSEFTKFKRKALNFVVRNRHLFRRANKNIPMRRVVDDKTQRTAIIEELHDQSGHRGRESTYRRVADRYWWDGQWNDVKAYVKTCEICQFRANDQEEEALRPTWTIDRWQKVGLDIVHMPPSRGFHYLVLARSDFSGWVEGRALRRATSESVARFLWEEVICRHGTPSKLVVDGGPENKDLVAALAERYNIRRVVVSAYHPQANGMVERGHAPIVAGLSKMTSGGGSDWVRHLPAILWADRTTHHASTGMTPYEIEHLDRAVLPIELEVPTWSVLPWEEVQSTADLLAVRARQLERRDEDLEEARLHLQRVRESNKDYFDENHRLRADDFNIGDLVLLHNTKLDKDMSHKLAFKWLGPFRIKEAYTENGTFILEELDGAQIRGTIAGNRLKHFIVRQDAETDNGHLEETQARSHHQKLDHCG